MLTINCSDTQIQLTEQECSYSIFLSNLLKYNETTLKIPFESKTINIYFSFLRNLFSKVDLGGEIMELLSYFSESKTVDNFIDDYINATEPQNMMDVIEFYERFNAYVNKNSARIYLYNNMLLPYSARELTWESENEGFSLQNKMIVYSNNDTYARLNKSILYVTLPNILNIIKNKIGEATSKELYENTKFLLKSMLKFYFYNKNRKFDN